jgi:hypothetical protein
MNGMKRLLIPGLLLIIMAGLVYRFYGGHEAPAGQPPLTHLEAANVDAIATAFNQARNEVRVLVLLSPT